MDQGKLSVRVGWDGRRIVGVAVANRRPQAAGLLVGRPPAEAAALAARLFSLCACAQGAAARLALAAAQGSWAADEALHLTLAREAIGEHLWRLLLDWPPLLGRPPERETFLRWRKRLLASAAPSDNAALGRELLDWLPQVALPAPPEPPSPVPVRLLPWRDAAAWAATAIDAGFAARPALAGLPAETGALARREATPEVAAALAAGRPLAARLAARRADLAFLAQALVEPARLHGWLDAAPVGDGIGLARAETARGLLLHVTQVKDKRVARHVIVAPTEWNFHPQGACAGELAGSPAATRDEAEMLTRRRVLALDPCVSYEVVVEHA